MAYYSKDDVRNYINENNQKIENKGHKSITPIEQSTMQLENEEDIVGFFWVNIDEKAEMEGAKVKLSGKTFVRIDFNLYTDDRFAIDLYQSQIEGVTVTQVIKNRSIDQERAKKTVSENKENIEDAVVEKLTNKQENEL